VGRCGMRREGERQALRNPHSRIGTSSRSTANSARTSAAPLVAGGTSSPRECCG
jgi:hypothetical protein